MVHFDCVHKVCMSSILCRGTALVCESYVFEAHQSWNTYVFVSVGESGLCVKTLLPGESIVCCDHVTVM